MKKELALMNAVGVFNHVAAILPNQHMQITTSGVTLQVTIYCEGEEELAHKIKNGLEGMILESATMEVDYIPWHKRREGGKDLYYVSINWDFEI